MVKRFVRFWLSFQVASLLFGRAFLLHILQVPAIWHNYGNSVLDGAETI
jgi:hypothetical protein